MRRVFMSAIFVAAISLFSACVTPLPSGPVVLGDYGGLPIIAGTPHEAALLAVYRDHHHGLILTDATTYTVRSGDFMASIAWNLYGDGYFYPIIMLASYQIVLDPDRIEPGMVLTVPNLETNLNNPTARANIRSFLLEIANIEDARGRGATAAGIRQRANAL